MDGGDDMNPNFIAGRAYEREEVVHIIHALQMVDDLDRVRTLLSNWEQELTESVVVVDTYVIK